MKDSITAPQQHYKFPLTDVKIEISNNIIEVEDPLYVDDFYRVTQNEFLMEVDDVGTFYAANGNYISMCIDPQASRETIELYLNGSTYGAILHQRKIMPMHGSCFVYGNKGIMLCGDSGAGKSSLTAAFVLDDNEFLTDDITPIVIKNNQALIWTMSDRIKLWEDSLKQLSESKESLRKIDPDTEKFYFPLASYTKSHFALDHILLLDIHDNPSISIKEVEGVEKIMALRKEIYRLEYMFGMPENESSFFKDLTAMCNYTKVTKLSRPKQIPIQETQQAIADYLGKIYNSD
ncbi:hypothetical protein JM79_2916 [Gramella sp. Hel_I_59]|uniref:hypothetical protein n=1 Tax=Gramella sp. Hel_I_59 TaxID=1249978 RepID=UPI00114FAEB4|nr:hypothetical protein [Gramella sp. Hel_I_59]TQI71965.1 hypothetical protein JM79_2916 [Gramella sp. Hel_I_59]